MAELDLNQLAQEQTLSRLAAESPPVPEPEPEEPEPDEEDES